MRELMGIATAIVTREKYVLNAGWHIMMEGAWPGIMKNVQAIGNVNRQRDVYIFQTLGNVIVDLQYHVLYSFSEIILLQQDRMHHA